MQYAQTNIQLYNQLRLAGWPDAHLRQVHAAYQLAMVLFTGHFRPNQKLFLAHLVGVASILADSHVGPTVVAAGLLHSAYSHGEFGDGWRGITSRKRRVVRQAVGAKCEAIIAQYVSLSWGLKDFAAILANRQHLSPIDEATSLVKLADVLEDHLDFGMRYSPRKGLPERPVEQAAWSGAIVHLAAALGRDTLAAELQRALATNDGFKVPVFLHTSHCKSFVVAPESHRARAITRLRRFYHSVRVKLHRFGAKMSNGAAR